MGNSITTWGENDKYLRNYNIPQYLYVFIATDNKDYPYIAEMVTDDIDDNMWSIINEFNNNNLRLFKIENINEVSAGEIQDMIKKHESKKNEQEKEYIKIKIEKLSKELKNL